MRQTDAIKKKYIKQKRVVDSGKPPLAKPIQIDVDKIETTIRKVSKHHVPRNELVKLRRATLNLLMTIDEN